MQQIIHRASERGNANHGWLNAHHSFSFAGFYNPQKMNFGVLRVLNDDIIAGGRGFGTHPHDNMEIITIPLEGDLTHKDSMGNAATIHHGDVQVMSAGTGIEHSEYNHNADKELKLLQIWMFPNQRNVEPRYDQISLNQAERHNKLQQILSPNQNDEGVWVHQEAWFHLGIFESEHEINYKIKSQNNGVYAFVISGSFEINGQTLNKRDAIGVWNSEEINFQSKTNGSEILLMDMPMEI